MLVLIHAEPVRSILHVDGEGQTRKRSTVDVAAMNGSTVVKAHLSLLKRHRDLDKRCAGFLESCFDMFEIVLFEGPQFVGAGPLMAAVDDGDRPHDLRAVVEGNPRGQHILRRARQPIRTIRVPSHNRRCVRGIGRLENELIVEEADDWAAAEPGRDGAQDRILDEPANLAILEGDIFAVPDTFAMARPPIGVPACDGSPAKYRSLPRIASSMTASGRIFFDTYQPCRR